MDPIIRHIAKSQLPELTALLDGGVSPQATFPAGKLVSEKFERLPGEWPLAVFAAHHGALLSLELLLERGATVPAEHLAGALDALAAKPDVEALVKTILETVDITANAAALSRGLITSFLTSNRAMLEVLVEGGASPVARDHEGRAVLATALGGVIRKGTRLAANRLAMLDLLIARGAPVEIADSEGNLALTYALQAASHEAALRLMQAGSPAVGRLSPSNTERLATAVERARAVKTPKGQTPLDMYTLADLDAWDVLLELGEAGMQLDVCSGERLNKGVWQLMRARAPLDLQLRAIPLIDDRDSLLRTLAAEARDEGGIAKLKAALALGYDLNLATASGTRPPSVLGAALEANASHEVLELLLAHGAALNTDVSRRPLAHCAARHVSKLQWLAERGVPLDELSAYGGTALHQAVASQSAESILFLVRRGARLDTVDHMGESPLTLAQTKGATDEVYAVLTPAKQEDVDLASLSVKRTERSALSLACAKGDLAALRLAISQGASADQPDARGSTPLAISAAHGWVDGVLELLALGAKPDTATRCGFLPVTTPHGPASAAIRKAGAMADTYPSHRLRAQQRNILRRGDVRALAAAIEGGMDVDLPLNGGPPLAIAVEHRVTAVVDVLLRAGADPHTTVDGATCVERSDEPAIVELLVKYGATRPAAANAEVDRDEEVDSDVPESGSVALAFAPALSRAIARMGGRVPADAWSSRERFATANRKQLSPVVSAFTRVQWPSEVVFGAGDPEFELSFGPTELEEDLAEGATGPLVAIGYSESQHYLVVRVEDTSADPRVYWLDHGGSDSLAGGRKLSAVLKEASQSSTAPPTEVGPRLIEAIRELDTKRALELVEREGLLAIAPLDKSGFTALHFACMAGLTDVVKALLARGADPNAALSSRMKLGLRFLSGRCRWGGDREVRVGEVPLHAALMTAPRPVDRTKDTLGIVRSLLAAGARVDVPEVWGRTLLQMATTLTSAETPVVEVLLAAGADPHAMSLTGGSPLANSLPFGADRVRLLLAAGVDPNRVTPSSCGPVKGATAIHMASWMGLDGALEAMLDAKGDPNVRAGDGTLPLACARGPAASVLIARGAKG